jgi:medium-chain acyl-[acyl-carrier-protein] hydrolase
MNSHSQWVPYRRRRPDAPVQLVCFPYAGGGASMYGAWGRALGEAVDLLSVQIPGREDRLFETPYRDVQALVRDAADALEPLLCEIFAVFGYSLGALLAFEFTRELRRRGRHADRLMVAAAPAPHRRREGVRLHERSDDELIEAMRLLGGTPEAVLSSRELMKLVLPAFRADLGLVERYHYEWDEPLGCPIHAFGGELDLGARPADVDAWAEHTSVGFDRVMFPSGHFFIHTHTSALVDQVARILGGCERTELAGAGGLR